MLLSRDSQRVEVDRRRSQRERTKVCDVYEFDVRPSAGAVERGIVDRTIRNQGEPQGAVLQRRGVVKELSQAMADLPHIVRDTNGLHLGNPHSSTTQPRLLTIS